MVDLADPGDRSRPPDLSVALLSGRRTRSPASRSSPCPCFRRRDADGSLLLGPGADELGALLGTDLIGVLEAARATGRAGEVTVAPGARRPAGGARPAGSVLLVGVGAGRRDDFRRAGAALARAVTGRGTVATTIPAVDPEIGLEAFVVGAVLGSFQFHWRSAAPEQRPPSAVVLAELPPTTSRVVERAAAIGAAAWRARGCWPGCRPTSRHPTGSPTRPSPRPRRPGSRSASGTRSSSPRRASAASSPSARPR